jgi:hypothetical protein
VPDALPVAEVDGWWRHLNASRGIGQLRQFLATEKVFIDPDTHRELISAMSARIARQEPFSAVRLGDGEGNVLCWGVHRDRFPEMCQACMVRIWSLMFGRHARTLDHMLLMHDLLGDAVSTADYIGIPTIDQYNLSVAALRAFPAGDANIKGAIGYSAVWDWVADNIDLTVARPTIVNCHVHVTYLKQLAGLLRHARRISIVSCYPDLLPRLCARFGVAEGATYLIPHQASNIGATPEAAHFPGRYEEIAGALESEDLSGILFLVGAGLPGKAYCAKVKAQGGMAIDVGSAMDIWVGKGVRDYHSAGFVAAHKL